MDFEDPLVLRALEVIVMPPNGEFLARVLAGQHH
jgi:hypothetical protein